MWNNHIAKAMSSINPQQFAAKTILKGQQPLTIIPFTLLFFSQCLFDYVCNLYSGITNVITSGKERVCLDIQQCTVFTIKVFTNKYLKVVR